MYLYKDTLGHGGTLIVGRLATRWGSHRWTLAKGYVFQWYGTAGWHFFLRPR